MCFGNTTNTTTTQPNAQVLQNYNDVTAQAKTVAATPYQPYTGELTAGLNQGQSDAINELQAGYGTANPYLNSGSTYLNSANTGLGGVQNYLQLGSQAAAQGQAYQGQAAGNGGPNAYKQYMSPYTQNVINTTMANAQQQDAIQAQQLSSNAIGQGAYGGDRAGVAQAALAGQQALANNQTIAGLQNQGYANAQQSALSNANLYGNLASFANQSAGTYNSLGQTQGQQANAYGTLAGQAGNLGQIAQSTNTSGASAALQASTPQQQNQQAQDTANYQQFQNQIQYPFQTTSYLANIDEGIGSNSGSSTTSPGASTLSQVAGAATTGLGILGATGAFGASGYLTSDERAKDDIEPIGKTFDGQTMYRYRYKGDPTVRTGLIAQEVERRNPRAVTNLGGLKAVDYGAATDRAADRGHFARGGGLGDIGGALIDNAMGRGFGSPGDLMSRSLGSLRGGFADGGATADLGNLGSIAFNPASTATNPAWSSAGLGVAQTGLQQPASSGGVRPSSMPILTAAPIAQPAASSAGLGGLAPSSSDAGAGGGSTGGNHDQNLWLGITAAGLGMMGGTSPQAGVNIGQGGLAGLKEYTTLQQQDRTNQLSQAELAIKQQQSALQLAQYQRSLQAAQALAGLGGGAAAPASAPGPSVAPAGGLGGLAPSSSGAPGSGAVSAPASSPVPSGGAPASTDATSTPAPSSSSGDFWSGVPNESNPTWLANQARTATLYGQPEIANKYLSMRDQILQQGTVLRNGQIVPIPGSIASSSAKAGADATATATGKQAGEVQNVYDPDGNPIAVPGSTYQDIVRKGGGVINGTPVTGAQSPYLKSDVENYGEFSKSAMAFEKDYGQNVYSLNALAHIYQNYQGGRGAEAIADLDGYAKQAGIEGLLPKGWQNSQAGFDSAFKSAVDQSFKTVAENGASKAPATALREGLMTTARPDADSAARFKIITDKLAALNYQHAMIGAVTSSDSKNVLRSMMDFQKSSPYGDYVNAARAGTPLPAGMNATSSNMVLGPTGGSRPGNGVQATGQPQGQAPPGASASSPVGAVQRPQSVPAGSAYSPSRQMWRGPDGTLYNAAGGRLQ